jgi:phosphoglycolate phosphatase-like HAD superfamily hydrolase
MGALQLTHTPVVRRYTLKPVELLRRLRDPNPPIAGLLLDSGGVLYDDTVWLRWLLKLVTRLGLHTHYTAFFRVWQREYMQRIKLGEMEYWQALRLFLRAAGLSNGQIDEVEAAGHARRRDCETEIYPFPGVVNVLSRLRDLGVQLTLFSSGCLDSDALRQQLAQLGLAEYFVHVLAGFELERTEPGPGGVERAVSLVGVAPGQLCYVGRDTNALAEASAAGLRTVAVNYDDDAEADTYIGHFDQLLEALPWKASRAVRS